MARTFTPDEAQRALRQLPKLAQEKAQQVIDVTAFQIAREAAGKAPVRTGLLRRSIAWKSRPRSLSAVVGVDNPDAFYWKFLEYGTVHIASRPMFRPAAIAMERDHQQRMTRALQQAADQLERM